MLLRDGQPVKERKTRQALYFGVSLASPCSNMTLWERALRHCGCGINCECGGIVRSYIFPGTLPFEYLHFSSLSNRRLNFFTEVC